MNFTSIRLGLTVCHTPEQFKAWSQNLGHEKVITTFVSFGKFGNQRQGEIIRDLATQKHTIPPDVTELARTSAHEVH